MTTIIESMRMLRDVEGVHGSFVVSLNGVLVESDLPAVCDGDVLGEVGARIARLYETFSSGGGAMETCVLRYAEHKLYIRKMTWGILGVLSSVGINFPALRMVANLVVRRVDPEIVTIGQTPPARTLRTPAPQALSQRAPNNLMTSVLLPSLPAHDPVPVVPEDGRDEAKAPSEPQVHMYRGRLVGD